MLYEYGNLICLFFAMTMKGWFLWNSFEDGSIYVYNKKNKLKILKPFYVIWVIVYASHTVFVFYAINKNSEMTDKLTFYVLLLYFFDILYTFSLIRKKELVTFAMLIMQIYILICIYVIYDIQYSRGITRATIWIYYLPFSINLSWSAYLLAHNFLAIAVTQRFSEINELTISIMFMLMLIIPTSFLLLYKNDVAYAAVHLICLFGLWLQNSGK